MFLAVIEPGLMDEPCDWDVCTEASTPALLSQLSSKTEKKRRAKSVPNQAPEYKSQIKQEKTHPEPRQGAHHEGNQRKVSHAKAARPPSPPQAAPTRKELQDALPKIPPLSSFKSCRSRFMTFEEAERDFQSFITTGLGRSVEIIREFRGREDDGTDEQNWQKESVTLYDDGAQTLKQRGKRMKSDISRPRSSSSSSQSDKDRGEYRAVTKPQTEARQTQTVSRQKAETINFKACTPSAPQIYPQTPRASNGGALSQPKNYESVPVVKSSRELNQTTPAQTGRNESREITEKIGKRSGKISKATNREQKGRERDEEEHDDDDEEEEEYEGEEEWSAETYWRASYRAWNDYYASMSPFKEHGYQNYYSVAHNWMAAYRMNAVYMEELLKH